MEGNKTADASPFLSVLVLILGITSPLYSWAATILVTSEADSGPGSLRVAVSTANQNVGLDIIKFADSVQVITLTTGQIEIIDRLEIDGRDSNGSGRVTISGGGTSRVLGVTNSSAQLFLRDLIIERGATSQPLSNDVCSEADGRGGGICSAADLFLINVIVRRNSTIGEQAWGGGIYVRKDADFSNSLITDNDTFGDRAWGGGAHVGGVDDTDFEDEIGLTARNVTFSDNRALGFQSSGGGFDAREKTVLISSVVSGNSTTSNYSSGGGLWVLDLEMDNSFVVGNTVNCLSSGGGIRGLGEALIENSTISNNIARCDGSNGAGIYWSGGIDLIKSTVSGNETAGAGLPGNGSAIYQSNTLESLVLRETTVTDNTTGGGSAIYSGTLSQVLFDRSIVSGNLPAISNFETNGNVQIISLSFALMGDSEAEFQNTEALVLINDTTFSDNPILRSLEDNGCQQESGFPESSRCFGTHLPSPQSPARDQGFTSANGSDQRGLGFPRLVGPATDIGSIELAFAAVVPSVDTLEFGELDVGETSQALGFELSNSGNIDLNISSLAIGGPEQTDFAIISESCTASPIPQTGSCAVQISFSPSSSGSRNAHVAVSSNSLDGPIAIALNGVGSSLFDLIAESPSVVDTALDPGQPFTVRARVRNDGSGASEPSTLRYKLSDDPVIDAGDADLTTDAVWAFGAGEEADFGERAAIQQMGDHWVGACVDPVPGEVSVTNNCSAAISLAVGTVLFRDSFEPRSSLARGLNDTGIDWCADDSNFNLECPVMGFEGQDGDFGRDARAREGRLDKVGAGAAGFDFTKLDANGDDLPESATEWSCVRDNQTGLIWEVKAADGGLRDKGNTYTWYNPDPSSNGGGSGRRDGGSCMGSECDTLDFVRAVNSEGLCGLNDWRMPSVDELYTIVFYGIPQPTVDLAFFPNTAGQFYWSSSPYAGDADWAWIIELKDAYAAGILLTTGKRGPYRIRLVRGGGD